MAERVRRKKEQTEYFFDYTLLFVVLFLLGFGLIMIYSVSSYEAHASYNDAAFFLKKQLFASIVGLVAMIVVANIPYTFWRRFAILGYVVSGILIALVPAIGVESHGAKRWIPIGPLTIQPAEVAKLCMILFLAYLVCWLGKGMKALRGILFTLFFASVMGVMVWKLTDNLSSAIIIVGIAVFMIFVSSPDYKTFIIVGAAGCTAIGILLNYISKLNMSDIEGFRFKRILAWMNPEAYAGDTGYQTLQSLYAIGSGGLVGKGLGQSMQKLGFIPEAQNDMIFSIICEELGLFGAVIVITMFLVLLWRMMLIANNAPDLFGSLLVVGVMGHIAIQVILNIAVVTNTIPNTGISLPFISYGGTSVMFLLIEIGLVLNVAKRIQLKEV